MRPFLVPKTRQPLDYLGFVIVVLTAGFVHAGHTCVSGSYGFVFYPVNIRRYGTTKGLSQLCYEGPLAETQLDPGDELLLFPLHALVYTLSCNERTVSQWPNALGPHQLMDCLQRLQASIGAPA